MASISDVFNGDAFSRIALTKNINNIPFLPGRIEQLGAFEGDGDGAGAGIDTQRIAVLSQDGILQAIPATGLATFENYKKSDPKNMRYFDVPHLQLNDTIWAHELVGKKEFGMTDTPGDMTATVQNQITKCQQKLLDDHRFTHEWMRVTAIKGEMAGGDGTVLYNYFDEWGVTKKTLTWNSAATGDINRVVRELRTHMFDANGGNAWVAPEAQTGIHCLVGGAFMTALHNDPTLSQAFDRYRDSELYRRDLTYDRLVYRGVTFENYQGKVNNNNMIEDNKGHAFPIGAGAFRRHNAPGDLSEAVGTNGLPFYSAREQKKFGTGWELYTQSNPIFLCTRPQMLVEIEQT